VIPIRVPHSAPNQLGLRAGLNEIVGMPQIVEPARLAHR
jgi:hypothetical protein